MKRNLAAALSVIVALSACADSANTPLSPIVTSPSLDITASSVALVTNGSNDGPGSFRQAIQDANTSSAITRIEFAGRKLRVPLRQTVIYSGSQPLVIEGRGATLDGEALTGTAAAFVANGGDNLELRNLIVREAAGEGIIVAIPANATGTIKVALHEVQAIGNGSHGVLINDQAEYFVDPNSTSDAGSDASLDVFIEGTRSMLNGFTALDQDGIRINEGGVGSLRAVIRATRVEGNGGDGVELDERGDGDVSVSVFGSAFNGNGGFDAADFDDGIDIDEAGDGSILGTFTRTSANSNFEQGFDINENDAGDIRVDMTDVEAIDNKEEGIEYEEDDDVAGGGNIVATLIRITARGNGANDGDAAVKLREKGAGNLDARLQYIVSSSNLISGILLREDADGNLTGRIDNATTDANNGDGIEFDENSTGDLTGTVQNTTSSNNAAAGVRADQGGTGTGALALVTVTTAGNVAGTVVVNAGVTVTTTP